MAIGMDDSSNYLETDFFQWVIHLKSLETVLTKAFLLYINVAVIELHLHNFLDIIIIYTKRNLDLF